MNGATIAAIALPAIATAVAIAGLRRSTLAARLADRPNERSLHSVPTPRIGGLGVLAGALPVAGVLAGGELGAPLACAAALGVLSFLDDLRSLPVQVRLAGHLTAAGVVVLAIGAPSPVGAGIGAAAALLLVLALVWMTNLFNFMDGADGLAGGMSAIGFATVAFAAFDAGAIAIALVATALASASAAFLVFNVPPAKVFLGDAGSIPLGFLAGALGAAGVLAGAWPWWFAPVVFSPFIVDATLTLARRLARGERILEAHRTHYYQRLALAGWPRRRLAVSAWALMAAAGAAALAARGSGGMLRCGILVFLVAALALAFLAIDRYAPARRSGIRGSGPPEPRNGGATTRTTESAQGVSSTPRESE